MARRSGAGLLRSIVRGREAAEVQRRLVLNRGRWRQGRPEDDGTDGAGLDVRLLPPLGALPDAKPDEGRQVRAIDLAAGRRRLALKPSQQRLREIAPSPVGVGRLQRLLAGSRARSRRPPRRVPAYASRPCRKTATGPPPPASHRGNSPRRPPARGNTGVVRNIGAPGRRRRANPSPASARRSPPAARRRSCLCPGRAPIRSSRAATPPTPRGRRRRGRRRASPSPRWRGRASNSRGSLFRAGGSLACPCR